MKIQNINSYIKINNNSKSIKNEKKDMSKKYDLIDIKGKKDNINKDEVSLNTVKKKVMAELTKETNAEKIERIKDSINNKTYKIDAEKIVGKLLE